MISAETIDRVRESADIVDIIGEHVKLRRAGADFRGPCPFHGGKNPNFSVSPRRGQYHCFKCGVSGDAISFVRERLGLDFAEAVRYVAERSGIEVKEERRGEQAADPREPLWEANAAAAAFFRDVLWTDDEAKAARDYLASREIDKTASDRFELGYAPRDGARLRAHLNAMGYDDARLLAAGLLVQREGQEEPRSRFWQRLMIPIHDASGRHVGFGGRVLGDGEPKYLNSSESEIFVKGRLLYGLSSARHAVRKADRALVVEGYFDAIRLMLAGVEETVAPLGTALTEQQAALLGKLTKNVFLLYDSDEAGLKATFRAGLRLLEQGVSARVASLPEGEDPDTFVRGYGAKGLEAQLAHAIDIFDRQILELQRRGWFDELHKKRRAIDRLLPTLRATADAVTRDIYIARLAEVSGVDRDVLVRELAAPDPRARGVRVAPSYAAAPDQPRAQSIASVFQDDARPTLREPSAPRQTRARLQNDRRHGPRRQNEWLSAEGRPRVTPTTREQTLERFLLRAMLRNPDQVDSVAERWGPEHFHEPALRRIFELLTRLEDRSLEGLERGLTRAEISIVNDLLAEPIPEPEADARVWLRQLQLLALKEEKQRIDTRLRDPEHRLPDEERERLVARKEQLKQEREALDTR